MVVNTTEREKSSLSKKPRVENSDDSPSEPKTMIDKEEELVIKLAKVEAQIETKTEEIKCFMIPVQALPPLGNIASVCGAGIFVLLANFLSSTGCYPVCFAYFGKLLALQIHV